MKKKKFLLLYLDGYLFSVAHGNRYLPRGGKEKRILILLLSLDNSLIIQRIAFRKKLYYITSKRVGFRNLRLF